LSIKSPEFAIELPETKELDYKGEGVDLVVGVRRKGATFDFYLGGKIGDKEVDARVSEAYGILCSYGEIRPKSIAHRLNEDLLARHGYVLPCPRLTGKIKELLKEFGL